MVLFGLVDAVDGGFLGWAWAFFGALITLAVFDMIVARKLLGLGEGTGGGARWFAVHAFANAVITVTSLPDLWVSFTDPVKTLTLYQICSPLPLMFNQATHMYHTIVYWKQMTFQDWLHHGVMTFIAVPIVFVQDPTPLINASHVFVTGFPGGVDYAMLAAVKQGAMLPITEKRINNALNVWCRAPGLWATAVLAYVQCCHKMSLPNSGYTGTQWAMMLVNVAIYYWNSFYFMERVVGNYHVVKEKQGSRDK